MPVPPAVKLIRSASLSGVAEYAYASTAPAGSRLIFLAGACPLNEDGSTAAVGDYAGQAAKAFANLRIALADAGASVEDVLQTRVLVASGRQEDLVAAWEVVRDSFGEHDVPSTLMGVTVLGYRDQLVEIEAVAAVLDSRSDAGPSGLSRGWRVTGLSGEATRTFRMEMLDFPTPGRVNRLPASGRIADDCGHGHQPTSRHVHRRRQAI
jgi:enamine deaminase RidA (YjgF/YER057c/UK114 family)